jgi:hypothetical protein
MTLGGTTPPAPSPRSPEDAEGVLRLTAVLTLLGAAAIHAKVIPEHFDEWVAAGVFFVALTVVQAALGIALLLSRRRILYSSALVVSSATVLIWAVSRTTGLPFGPEAGTAEVVGRPDTVSTILELVTVAATLPLLKQRPFLARWPSRRGWALVAVVAVIVASSTGFAVASRDEGCGGHVESPTGPLLPVDGHSALARQTPVVVSKRGETLGVVVALLKNCGDSPAVVESTRLGTLGGGVEEQSLWVVPTGWAEPGQPIPAGVVRAHGQPLPGAVPVEPTDGRPRQSVVLLLTTRRATTAYPYFMVQSVTVTYSDGGRDYTALFASVARVRVKEGGKT